MIFDLLVTLEQRNMGGPWAPPWQGFSDITLNRVNPNQAWGWRKYVTTSLTACRSEWNRARSVKTHCICHFWCLKSLYGMIFVCLIFSKKFVTTFLIFYQKLNSICFLLSFVYILYILTINDSFSKN